MEAIKRKELFSDQEILFWGEGNGEGFYYANGPFFYGGGAGVNGKGPDYFTGA